jgi:hypothetical protein
MVVDSGLATIRHSGFPSPIKPHRATPTSRPISMFSPDHNLDLVIGVRRRW